MTNSIEDVGRRIRMASETKPQKAEKVMDVQKLKQQFEMEVHQTENGLPGNPASWIANEALWDKAKRASQEAFGSIKYPFVVWWYLHHGGKKK